MGKLISPELIKILACPVCKSDVELRGEKLVCTKCHREFPIVDSIPIMLTGAKLGEDLKLTRKKWDEEYEKYHLKMDLTNDLELRDAYIHVKKLIKRYTKLENGLFLEAGCGAAKLSSLLAKEGIKTVGVDISLNGLSLAKTLFKREGVNGLFVCGNILEMPFKDNVFSFVYTGGVLEHFKDTQKAVNEIYRVLSPGGFATNTVPYLSLSTIYRIMRWGNIPDIPIISNVAEFIEIKLLKSKHMRFGYEKSFASVKIKKIFRKAGFNNIEIGLFKTFYPLEVIRSSKVRSVITEVVNSSRIFWPMIYINCEK